MGRSRGNSLHFWMVLGVIAMFTVSPIRIQPPIPCISESAARGAMIALFIESTVFALVFLAILLYRWCR